MITIHSADGNIIANTDDWLRYSPPAKKELQWRHGRSAKELAKSWFRTGKAQMPAELTAILQSHPTTNCFQMETGIPEKETKLDDFKGSGRIHDMILLGNTRDNRVLISIEAKADEPFGEVIGDYVQSSLKSNPRSRVPDRIRQLAMGLFGHTEVSTLRYQLVHAVAGTLIEALNQQATQAVFIIHEFIPATGKTDKAKNNELDLEAFIALLSDSRQSISVGKLSGPFYMPGNSRVPSNIPLYIGKIETVV
ncbi:hypothetical protein SD70_21135 [Gordoniibacillus kamchatkensis]|uniref:DUF6946 domain-containing protein n=1 Tax=Gordoniibacillus kamchatkensis TaxID=1590651 RepID=A0ABR5AE33_9BACL|nr:hypothetical protein [Paenibacillus sp. VKM B-2647]KIL39301.1 hypothetical protein SD70_21135 [Paenibacillus sp. VKM B-2647]